ncbi:MAG: caspase family protein, partial [Hyphomicrobiales bacterium]|nr:caspase family protein [Hyphomicrobiales bacterium]
LMVLVSAAAQAETRIALIIGNSDYAHTQKLDNPANDANLLAASLQSIGFQVDSHTDLEQKKLRRAVASFARKITDAGPDTMAFFFYAGHGLQVNGTNFLIPVDAQIEAEADVPVEGVSANDVFHTLRAAGAKVNVIVLDACRNNPFKAASRSMSRGLARMVTPAGSIISYATAPGRVAADGDGANSPFSAALAKVIVKPGLTIEQVFKQVRIAVHETTNGEQLPTEESQLLRDVYFAGQGDQTQDPPKIVVPVTPDPATGNKDDAQLAFFKALELNTLEAYEDFLNNFSNHKRAGQVREIIKSMSDEQMWLRIKKADTVAAYRQYLIAFSEGIYASEASERIGRLQQQAKLDPPTDPPKLVDPPKQRDPQVQTGTCRAPHGKYRVRGVSSNDVLNIRSGPGSKFPIVGDIPPNGRGVAVEGCAPNNSKWCIVRYNCYRGWASIRYLTRSGGSSGGGGSAARLYRVIDHIPPDMLNVRAGPGTSNRITSRIPYNGINVRVANCRKVSGYRYKWCVVTYQGQRGWAYARYLADMATGARPR